MSKPIPGYDYRTGTPVEKTKAEWREFIAQAMRQGGWRRLERKETFIHGTDGRIVAEAYAVIPPPKQERDANDHL